MKVPKLRETASLTLVWIELPFVNDDGLVNQFDDPRFAHIHRIGTGTRYDPKLESVDVWSRQTYLELLNYVRHAGPNTALVLGGWNLGATVARWVADLYPSNVVGFMGFGDPTLPGNVLDEHEPLVSPPPFNTQWRYQRSWDGDAWCEPKTPQTVKFVVRDTLSAHFELPGSDGFGRLMYANALWENDEANHWPLRSLGDMTPNSYAPNGSDAMVELEEVQLFRVVEE